MTALVRIVLIEPSHPGNIGSVARAMKNMALDELVLVRPRSFPHAEANALAAGADDILAGARVVATTAEAVGDCGFIAGTTSRPRSYYWEFTTPRDVAGRIVGLDGENRAALLFGSERYGLANEDLQYCNVLVRIPANPDYCSLNLAMSVLLLAYEIFMAREQPESRVQLELPLAASSDVEHFYAHLNQVLEEIDFERPHRAPDGALAAALQSRATRPQRAQHHARHLERRAGTARSVRAPPARMSMPGVYLDYAATTPVAPEVAARMARVPDARGSVRQSGIEEPRLRRGGERAGTEAARAQVAAAVGAEPGEIIWTSGATEADNLAIFGIAHYYRDAGRHIVTVRTEHKAVLDPCRELERRGWRVTYLTPDRDGMLDPEQVAAALRPDTVLVSIMHVNNEIGVIQDIAAIASLCARSGSARLHVDAAQSVGKCAVNFAALGVDLHVAVGAQGVRTEGRRSPGRVPTARCAAAAAAVRRRPGARPALRYGGDASGGGHGRGVRAGEGRTAV